MKWLILLFPMFCQATEYRLTYHLVRNRVDNKAIVKVDAGSYSEAIRKGSDVCLHAFWDLEPITESFKIAVANACTNPDHYLDDEYYN